MWRKAFDLNENLTKEEFIQQVGSYQIWDVLFVGHDGDRDWHYYLATTENPKIGNDQSLENSKWLGDIRVINLKSKIVDLCSGNTTAMSPVTLHYCIEFTLVVSDWRDQCH